MAFVNSGSVVRFLGTASSIALCIASQAAIAQDADSTGSNSSESEAVDDDFIVVSGIRASLRDSMNIKRNGQGVVDAISAEDIGKFPDTNLAESLQRITGVSIDRNSGEGSTVTVRGFGPEFNLVTLNGRQMPTASFGDGASPPSSRSFDFANLASEGVAGVEVYKTGRASVPSGGIGSTINILTPRPLDRPGLHGSVAVKGVLDTSRNDGNPITPEVSGIISNTFADNRIGIMVNAVYQRRKASVNTAGSAWRDGYLGCGSGYENEWGAIPCDPGNDWRGNYNKQTNRPGATDVYEVPQEGSYSFADIDRIRINGQAVLQVRPTDALTATIDYTFSQNTIENRTSSVGVWFNHNNTSSAWTDGPIAAPLFYSEEFGPAQGGPSDLSYSGSLAANRSINKSLGFNLEWEGPDGMTFVLDYHNSSAETKPTNQFGSNMSLGTAVYGVAEQGINYENYLPVISYTNAAGFDSNDPAQRFATGNAFRNAYSRNDIEQIRLDGQWEADLGFLKSVDFGVTYTDSKVRSAFGVIQNDTWGGAGPASDIPDDIFYPISVPDKFAGLSGADDPNIIQSFYGFDFERMALLIDSLYGTCGGDGDCLAEFTTDRRITEKTLSPYLEGAFGFDIGNAPVGLIMGLRYVDTTVDSSALVPIPVSTQWISDNEFNLSYGEDDFTRIKGGYDYWLPAIDFDIEPIANVKLRASYSHTITRPTYDNLQGGRTFDQLFRIGGGSGSQGNPSLLPFKSENFDASAEWYYGPASYVSVGYFRKNVENFISQDRIDVQLPGVYNPATGARYDAAIAALGQNASPLSIRRYIVTNFPGTGTIDDRGDADPLNDIIKVDGVASDDLLNFQVTLPVNSDQTATLDGWEFAIQHNFWETGFGVILNYTMVNGDARYDNTQPYKVTQFALTGLSDSANAVAFYDKGPIQARVAWNWREEFLAGSGPNPFYVEEYWQIDASASFDVREGLSIFGEVINLTGESRRGHRRSDNNVFFVSPGAARYAAGVRFTF